MHTHRIGVCLHVYLQACMLVNSCVKNISSVSILLLYPKCPNYFCNMQISTLHDALEKYWPSLSCGSPSSCRGTKGSFWAHEVVSTADFCLWLNYRFLWFQTDNTLFFMLCDGENGGMHIGSGVTVFNFCSLKWYDCIVVRCLLDLNRKGVVICRPISNAW